MLNISSIQKLTARTSYVGIAFNAALMVWVSPNLSLASFGFLLWTTSPWLMLLASLKISENSEKGIRVHAVMALSLAFISILVYLGTAQTHESMGMAIYLSIPIAALPLVIIAAIAGLLNRREN
ncbi:hypothetical protein [Rhodoferax sp. GW822-FHT02A01]|uniref:hypothetical protein n=1 Tax=Rhodoferax sp. GW822-FHT02A01 TaxID=3141537 RepID=UPI00315C50D3